MAKKQKKCQDCVLCEKNEFGLTHCKLWGQKEMQNVVFPENRACKMITGPVNLRQGKPSEPATGEAPFCGDYPKCNNAEGCDACAEFEEWIDKGGR